MLQTLGSGVMYVLQCRLEGHAHDTSIWPQAMLGKYSSTHMPSCVEAAEGWYLPC
jgi:hypothetical protein